ncbi:MAG TPA: cupin domain-containing protein [Actinophytocola sp.]|uniref:cupin domain-containing protein n=1 Tax=Actinophytocola sp. TaxID=1872138 RepID=UPI002DB68BEB|nr:cupin domain-containing protein [Actinophytocola sp.]HEU5469980.1 cupin domain-containing protein [Actinophytocola sp.]
MRKLSLDAVAREQMKHAMENSNQRSAKTVYGGHERVLRQSVIALVQGAVMGDHLSPGEATLHVLQGRIRLTAGKDSWDCRTGDLLDIPADRHSVTALEPSVVLLTVAKP